MTYSAMLEDLLGQLGGCGLHQWLLSCIVHGAKIMTTWSMIFMAFAGQDPGFRCLISGNDTLKISDTDPNSKCDMNGTKCSEYNYEPDMVTVLSDFNLVCDRKWIVAMITTIQMAGVLVGCFVAGHLADLIGRKPTFFSSLLIQIVFNVVGYFSTGWEMYAAIRFVIGLGVGMMLTVQYSLTLEFASAKWRPAIVSVPTFGGAACLYALLAWALHDWRNVHLGTAIVGVPFLLTWWIVPESFRWLVTQKRYNDAERVIEAVAKRNGVPMPDITDVMATAKQEEAEAGKQAKKYTALDLFRTRDNIKTTVGLLFIWFAASYGYYGITFGVKSLSGDLYMNIFLVNVVETPSTFMAIFLVNWFGRKKTCFFFYVLSGVAGIAVGILQYIDLPIGGQITNILALVAKLGVASGWQAMVVFTNELYPTAVRTIAYGVHSTSARVGGMVAPQIVFLNDSIPGLLYFLSGVLMIVSAGLILIFRETKDCILDDALETEVKVHKTIAMIEQQIKVDPSRVIDTSEVKTDGVKMEKVADDSNGGKF